MKRPVTAIAALLFAAAAHAGTIPLRWDPVTAADLAGYRVFWGTAPGVYPQFVDVGLVTSYELAGLPDCATVCVAVKSRDTAGNLSAGFSPEVCGWSRVVITPAAPRGFETGGTYSVSIAGANFKTGALIYMDSGSTRIQGTAVAVPNCSSATFTVAVPSTAPTGTYSLTVESPDGTWGSLQAFAGVSANASPPTVPTLRRQDDKTQ